MTSMERKLEESYQHIKDYIPKCTPLLTEMCKNCEMWNGKEHDYSECREKTCFKLFLGYEYANWCDSFE